MAMRQPAHDRYVEHERVAASTREPFGFAQPVCLIAGVFFVVIGAVGLARAGLESATSPRVVVAGLGMTPIMAAIHLVLGLFLMAGAATRASARGIGSFFGPVMIAFGIIAMIQPIDSLGIDVTNGIASLLTGAFLLIAAIASPPAIVQDRSVVEDRSVAL